MQDVGQGFKKINMGMVGGAAGAFIGNIHRMAARLDGRVNLVAGAFSRDFELTKQTGLELGLAKDRLYSSYEDMLSREALRQGDDRMDFVVIVTPNHLHFPIAKATLKAGFHVLSDKPATMTYAETIELEEIIGETGCLYGLTHTYLGYPMVKEARAIVMSGKLGAIRKIIVEYSQGWLSQNEEVKGNKQAAWRVNPDLAGISGCMGDIGTHAHCLAEYISNNIMTDVCADLHHFGEGRVLDDDGSVLFRMTNNIRGALVASQISTGEDNALRIKVFGEKGGLEWCQEHPSQLLVKMMGQPVQIYNAGQDKEYLCDEARAACRLPAGHPEGYIEAFANIYLDFIGGIDAWKKGMRIPDMIDIEEGKRGMAFIEAVVASNLSNVKWTKVQGSSE